MNNIQNGMGELILIDYERNPEFSRDGNPRTFEFVWSMPMGDGTFRLFHSPLWTRGINLNDVVTVDKDRVVTGVKQSAEYRSCIITFADDDKWYKADWPLPVEAALEKVHCEISWLADRQFVVSVHRKVSNEELAQILKENGDPEVEWIE